jgi:hypothetical protein
MYKTHENKYKVWKYRLVQCHSIWCILPLSSERENKILYFTLELRQYLPACSVRSASTNCVAATNFMLRGITWRCVDSKHKGRVIEHSYDTSGEIFVVIICVLFACGVIRFLTLFIYSLTF